MSLITKNESDNKKMVIHNRYKDDGYQKIVPFIIFILALILLFALIKPMITIILSSVLIAYISFPLYKRISKKISRKFISITLSLFIVFIIIMIPFSFLAYEVTQQGYTFYNSLSNKIVKGEVFGFGCISADSKVCLLLNQAEKFSSERLSKFGVDKQMQKLLPILEEKITTFILSIPLMIAQIFITFVLAYFILKDWENILKQIIYIIPLRTKTTNRLVKEFGNVTHTVIYAQLFVALIQGAVATIGFYIFGVPFPVILGILTAFCTLIPTAGTAIIWLPASLYLILSGSYSHNYWILYKGIGLLLYSFFIINLIDNLLLAKIVHEKAKVSQISIIIGVVGGAVMFGIMGIFIGPILLPLLITYFETFKERFR
jgi:predicted PurR-regulated permease PerM